MKTLSLRRLSSAAAMASSALGRGRFLEFASGVEKVRVTLSSRRPSRAKVAARYIGFSCQHGPLLLANADALLSLCGEVPVITTEPWEAWYWQLINQQMAPALSELLAPLEPLIDQPELIDRQDCRVLIERNGERAYGALGIGAESLLRVLNGAPWGFIEQMPTNWMLPHPVAVGRIDLLISELLSLRPGDVLFPSEAAFDVQGRGSLQLGNQRWAVCTEDQNVHLQLRLIHEEGCNNEQ